MPKQTISQETGRIGERWFVSQSPPNWLFQPPLEDIGIDGVVVICESGPANGPEFRVQIKSNTSFGRKGDCLIIPGTKHSSMQYWVSGFTPTLLVAYETSTAGGYCSWANQLLAPVAEAVLNTDGVRQIELHTAMPVNETVWERVRDQLGGIIAALGRRLLLASGVVPFLRAINALSGSLKDLYFAEAARPPESERTTEQSRLMHQLEATCHRDAVRAILDLERELTENGVSLGGLREYAEEYTRRCSGFIRGFRETIATDGPVQCEVIAEGFAERVKHFETLTAGN